MTPITVLYVDDDARLLEICRIYLEKISTLKVDTALSAKDALAKLATSQYDAIVSDYEMPKMNGIDFLKVVRKKYGGLPFIIFTGRGREEIVIEAINSGADFYLQKGGEPESQFTELAHEIRHAVKSHRADLSLRESEERLRLTVDATNDGIWDWDIPSGRAILSPHWWTMLGYEPDEMPARYTTFLGLIHPEDRERVEAEIQGSLMKKDTGYAIEMRMHAKTGKWKWVLTRGKVVTWDPDGRPVNMVGIQMDISAAKQAELLLKQKNEDLSASYEQITATEEELRQNYEELARSQRDLVRSEGKYRRVIETALEGIWILDAEFRITFTNSRMTDILGYPAEEMMGRRISDFISPDEGSTETEIQLDERRKGISGQFERRHVCKDGTIVTLLVSATPVIGDDGSFRGSFSMFTDISDRKRAEDALRESEARLRSLVETTHDSVVLIDEEGKVIEWNAGSERITGIRKERALGRPLWDLDLQMHPPGHRTEGRREENERKLRESLKTGVPIHPRPHIVEIVRPDGSRLFIQESIFSIKTDKGFRFGSVSKDITDEKRAADAISQANRQLNILTSITRHDLLNNITAIRGYLSLVGKIATDPEIRSSLYRRRDYSHHEGSDRIHKNLSGSWHKRPTMAGGG
jgi:PAS domain S-box-containing protein